MSHSEVVAAQVQAMMNGLEVDDLNSPVDGFDWLGVRLERGEVYGIAAPGGRAKTSLAIVWAHSLSSGKNLVGEHVYDGTPRR
jgi:hypothetical protein